MQTGSLVCPGGCSCHLCLAPSVQDGPSQCRHPRGGMSCCLLGEGSSSWSFLSGASPENYSGEMLRVIWVPGKADREERVSFASEARPLHSCRQHGSSGHTLAPGSPLPDLYTGGPGQNLCVSSFYTEGCLNSPLSQSHKQMFPEARNTVCLFSSEFPAASTVPGT